MAQVVKHHFSKCEALSSNSILPKIKQNKAKQKWIVNYTQLPIGEIYDS
jgi:hypothetical protein